MPYLLQVVTILFAVALAWHEEVPIRKMIDYGASLREEKDFHLSGWVLKAFYVLAVNIAVTHTLPQYLKGIALHALLLWLAFDIITNIFHDKRWDYIGDTAAIDKWLNRHGIPGRAKAVLCAVLIIIINLIY